MIDVTVPFETDDQAFDRVRQAKLDKYSELAEWLKNKYESVVLDAFIMGSLGSWCCMNDQVLRILNISRKYAILFRKLCCIDAIQGSNAIWRARCKN